MLTQISIENFASCGRANFTFEGAVAALIGRNGVGKTNILKAIEWIGRRGSIPEPLSYPYVQTDGMTTISVTLKLDLGYFGYTLGFLGPDFATKYPGSHVANSVIETVTRYEANGASRILIDRADEMVLFPAPEFNAPAALKINSSIPALPALVSFLPADHALVNIIRPIRDALAGIRYYTLDEQPGGTRDYVLESEYQSWIGKLRAGAMSHTDSISLRLLHMHQEDRSLFQEFRDLLGPNGLGLVDVQVTESARAVPTEGSKEQDAARSKVYFFMFTPLQGLGGQGKIFYYSNLSAGTRRAIRMLVSMLFDKRSLMLVEQPEDSMHPGLLAKLVDLMRGYSHRTQFVFTTHSPYVLDILRPNEVLLVSAPQGRTNLRPLTGHELGAAKDFLEDEGSFSEFLNAVESGEEE